MQLIAAGVLFWSALLLELCWLGAWAAFVWEGFSEGRFPLPELLLCAGLAALFVRVTAGQRLRNVHVLALHAACAGGLWFFMRRRDASDGLLLALGAAAFWINGALHARRTLTHRVVCARFDFGMYWLLALLGLRVLLRFQVDVPQQAELSDALVPCFFVNALCAICVARYRSQVSKQWLRVSGRIVMLFGGLAALGALGFSIMWLCRPYLRSIAETSHAGAASLLRPIANAAAELLFAAMREGKKHPVPQYFPGRMPIPWPGRRSLPDEPLEVVPADEVTLTMICIVAGVLALIGAVFWLWWNRHWLLAEPSAGAPANGFWAMCQALWRRALAWFCGLRANAEAEPLRLMNALLIWGERSGVTREGAETPLEYAGRLKLSFAAMSGAIDSIVDTHCRQTYALSGCDDAQLGAARRALRELRSPRQWWARIRSRWRAMHARQVALP